MGRTVLLAKKEPGSAPGVQWKVAGEDGAQEVDAAYAEHLLRITGNDFFVVPSRDQEVEEPVEVKEPVKPKAKPKVKPEPAVEDDLTEALKVASSTTHQKEE